MLQEQPNGLSLQLARHWGLCNTKLLDHSHAEQPDILCDQGSVMKPDAHLWHNHAPQDMPLAPAWSHQARPNM